MAHKRSTVFPPDVAQAIQEEATRRGISASDLIRAAVVTFLNQAGAYPRKTYSPTKGSSK